MGQTSLRWRHPDLGQRRLARARSGRPGSPRTTLRQTFFHGISRGDWKDTARRVATSTYPVMSRSRSARIRSSVLLPQPLAPEQHHELARLDVQVEMRDDGAVAEGLGQVADPDRADSRGLPIGAQVPVNVGRHDSNTLSSSRTMTSASRPSNA